MKSIFEVTMAFLQLITGQTRFRTAENLNRMRGEMRVCENGEPYFGVRNSAFVCHSKGMNQGARGEPKGYCMVSLLFLMHFYLIQLLRKSYPCFFPCGLIETMMHPLITNNKNGNIVFFVYFSASLR